MMQKKVSQNSQNSRRGTFFDASNQRHGILDPGSTAVAMDRRDTIKLKSDMKICLDRESARYLTGEIVKGTITIALTQEVRVKDLTLRFFGDGRVSWNERRSYIKGSSVTVNLKNTDVFMDQTISLLNKGSRNISAKPTRRSTSSSSSAPETEVDDSLLLPAGLHSFPFQLKLPTDLPASTFDSRWGQVRYTIKALLQRPWKFDIERERELMVMTTFDLNDEPELARPIGCLGEFSPGPLCCRRTGQVTTELRIGRRGYAPGEKITFHVEIENNGRRKLHNHRVALVQHVTFRAKTKVRKLSNCICSLSRGEVLPGTSSVWTNEFLTVPVVPPTSNKSYRNIQIKYTFSLFVCHSSWSDEFCLPVTVVIGTSRLKQDTINHYMSMITGTTMKPPSTQSQNASTSELSSSANNSSVRSSSRFLPRSSLTAPDDSLRRSNGSLELRGRTPRTVYRTDHASSTNPIHRSFDCIHEPMENSRLSAFAAAQERSSSCRMSN